jgi:hypothetical protein
LFIYNLEKSGAKLLKKNDITAFSTLFNVKKCEKLMMSLEKSSLVSVVIAGCSSVASPLFLRSSSEPNSMNLPFYSEGKAEVHRVWFGIKTEE